MTEQEDREFMAGIEADVVRRLPEAMDQLATRPILFRSVPDGEWVGAGYIHAEGLTMVPTDPPALEAIDVTWPDGTYKVFPDRVEYTLHVDEIAPEARGIWARIEAAIQKQRLEASILADLSAIITERGPLAPGLLIIHTPGGEWAVTESEWLAPGSAVLSRLDQPDLMAVAQGDGWLYYRQGPAV